MSTFDPTKDPCLSCGLWENCKRPKLDGRVPTRTLRNGLMFVGEAPGGTEDITGDVFSGPSGRELNGMQTTAGINPAHCIVVNTVRCAPRAHKTAPITTPSPKHVNACKEFLHSDIEWYWPKVVIMLGAVALKGTLGLTGITKVRGQVLTDDRYPGIKFVPTFHPAYVLRYPMYRKTVVQDFKLAMEELNTGVLKEDDHQWYLINSNKDVSKLSRSLMDANMVSFDLETFGLNPRAEHARIYCISFSWDTNTAACVPIDHRDRKITDEKLEWFLNFLRKRFFLATEIDMGGQNVSYDYKWLLWFYDIRIPRIAFDCTAYQWCINENLPRNLEQMTYQYVPQLGGYDADFKKKVGKKWQNVTVDNPIEDICTLEELSEYSCADSDLTRRIAIIQEKKLRGGGLRPWTDVMAPALEPLVVNELRGITLSKPRLKKIQVFLKKNLKKALYLINREHIIKKYTLFVDSDQFNPGSPKQLREVLFGQDFFDLTPIKETIKGLASTDKSVMSELQHHKLRGVRKLAKLVQAYKKYQKYLGTYAVGLHDAIDEMTGKFHPVVNMTGTVTGRTSAPRIHQIPTRDTKIFKKCFYPGRGTVFINGDYSQIELRILAIVAREDAMLRIFLNDGDIHRATAAEIYNIHYDDITELQRDHAKTINFGILYGMGHTKLGLDLGWSPQEAKRFINKFFAVRPRIKAYINDQHRIAKRNGEVVSPFGRVRHLPGIESNDDATVHESLRQAVNSPIQSAGSDIKLLAMAALHNQLIQFPAYDSEQAIDTYDGVTFDYSWGTVAEVHDSIMVECPIDFSLQVCKLMRVTMESILPEWAKKSGIIFKADIEMGNDWGSVEPVDLN